ncbi:hypothetical protein H6504_00680 [Candidatus Woesearchaeota archaeon]|nr:hypothetical protein [Candidatus Woesearchaeota archaeon]
MALQDDLRSQIDYSNYGFHNLLDHNIRWAMDGYLVIEDFSIYAKDYFDCIGLHIRTHERLHDWGLRLTWGRDAQSFWNDHLYLTDIDDSLIDLTPPYNRQRNNHEHLRNVSQYEIERLQRLDRFRLDDQSFLFGQVEENNSLYIILMALVGFTSPSQHQGIVYGAYEFQQGRQVNLYKTRISVDLEGIDQRISADELLHLGRVKIEDTPKGMHAKYPDHLKKMTEFLDNLLAAKLDTDLNIPRTPYHQYLMNR